MTNTLTLKRRLGLTALSLMFVIIGCGKDDKTGERDPQTDTTISEMSVITTTADKRSLVGRKVDIANVQVGDVVGNYVFWAGESHSGSPVVRMDKMRAPVAEHVRSGDRVRLQGTIRLVESVGESDLMWDKVNDSEKRDIQGAQIYIAAESVAVRK